MGGWNSHFEPRGECMKHLGHRVVYEATPAFLEPTRGWGPQVCIQRLTLQVWPCRAIGAVGPGSHNTQRWKRLTLLGEIYRKILHSAVCGINWGGHHIGGRGRDWAGDHSQASYHRGEELGSQGGTMRTHLGSTLSFRVSPASMFVLLLVPELFVNNLPLSKVQGQPALHSCGLWQAEGLNRIWWLCHLSNCHSLLQLLLYKQFLATWLSELHQLIQILIHQILVSSSALIAFTEELVFPDMEVT